MPPQLLNRTLPHRSEPVPSGNLPLGFDPTTCRSVYVGNIHTQVTELLLQEIFTSTGPVETCKLIRKDKSSYGFVHYFDRRSAALAIMSLNGRHLFEQPIKVNWAYATGKREDTSSSWTCQSLKIHTTSFLKLKVLLDLNVEAVQENIHKHLNRWSHVYKVAMVDCERNLKEKEKEHAMS